MSNKPVRFVPAVCACGASFDREVKRGRPQVWCPACIEVPFEKRVKVAVAPLAEGASVVEGEEQPKWDAHGAIRHLIEANVAEVYAGWPTVRAALLAADATEMDIGIAQDEALRAAYKAAGVS